MSQVSIDPVTTTADVGKAGGAKAGGFAALYIAAAYCAAIPYFLVAVNYPSVVDPVAKVLLLRDHFASMYAMHLLVYEFVGVALIVLVVALDDRLQRGGRALTRVASVVGVVWACLLVGSSMVFNYGMGAVVRQYPAEPTQAVWMWQVVETIAQAIGGAGGELLGGLWMLLVSLAAHRGRALPKVVNGLGAVTALAGLASNVPILNAAGVVFGLLQIVWFAGVGVVLIRSGAKQHRGALTESLG